VNLVAVIADTHMPRGERRLPAGCVDRLAAADLIVHAGDFTAAEVLEEMSALGPPVEAVHGNMDDPELMRRLPERRTIEVERVAIGMVHDSGPPRGRLDRLRRSFPDADAVVFAHSHIPLHERDGEFQIFNPGSPTERRRAPAHTMGMARVDDGSIEFELVVLDRPARE
jgi:putative phosphoesterase